MTTAWMFPGQGSQREGTGRDLPARHPDLARAAEEVLGCPLPQLTGGDSRLRSTEYLQPLLFAVCVAEVRDAGAVGERPDVVAGHSLGEYAALFAAGSLDVADGLRLVRRRGELMTQATGGRMLAVVGFTEERIAAFLAAEGAVDVDVANVNAGDQVVLSGPEGTLRLLADRLRAAGAAKCVLLGISIAAHSRYMAHATRLFAADLKAVPWRRPRVPVVVNGEVLDDPGAIATTLAANLAEPVRWTATTARLRAMGVREVRELGPGRVLTKLWAAAGG